jgi:hypothetical protein
VKGEPRARFRTEKQILATLKHERDLHKEFGRAFDRDNQNRVFPKVYPTIEKAQSEADRQLNRDWDKTQKHDYRFEDVMKKESFR